MDSDPARTVPDNPTSSRSRQDPPAAGSGWRGALGLFPALRPAPTARRYTPALSPTSGTVSSPPPLRRSPARRPADPSRRRGAVLGVGCWVLGNRAPTEHPIHPL